ncbi:MAG: M16 family metallopeptidase [Fibrobacterota bacterium]
MKNNPIIQNTRSAIPVFVFLALLMYAPTQADSLPHPSQLTYPALNWQPPTGAEYYTQLSEDRHLYFAPDSSLGIFSLRIIFSVPAYEDPWISRAYADLFGETGTSTHTAGQVDSLMELYAVDFSVQRNFDNIVFSMRGLREYYDQAVQLLAARMKAPVFTEDRIIQARRSTLQALDNRFNTPEAVLKAAWKRTAHPDPRISGLLSRAQVEARSPQELEKALQKFHTRLRTESSVIYAAAGMLSSDSISAVADRLTPKGNRSGTKSGIHDLQEYTPTVQVVHTESNQAFIAFGQPLFTRPDDRYYPLTIFNEILGGSGFTSKLMKEIRSDRGLTYSIHSRIRSNYDYPADFAVTLFTKTGSVNEALFRSLDIVETSLEDTLSTANIEKVRSRFISTLPSYFRTATDMAVTFAENREMGREETHYREYPEKLKQITPSSIAGAVDSAFARSAFSIVVVGDTSQLFAAPAFQEKSLQDLTPAVIVPEDLLKGNQ